MVTKSTTKTFKSLGPGFNQNFKTNFGLMYTHLSKVLNNDANVDIKYLPKF